MSDFAKIYDAAVKRHGEGAIEARVSEPSDAKMLKSVADDRYLSSMSLRIFSAGLKHDMVRAKWPAFEEVFHGFDPGRVGFMNEEDLDRLLGDARIIRHAGKIKATFHNGGAMQEIANTHGGFGAYLADWPGEDLVGLWEDLGKRFKHVGGNSGPYFLRMVGKDTFTMSNDVIRGLSRWCGLADAGKNKTNRKLMQAQFNDWQTATGRPYCELSMILALST
jgi:3-methyladenine DNA glycosylase Tag